MVDLQRHVYLYITEQYYLSITITIRKTMAIKILKLALNKEFMQTKNILYLLVSYFVLLLGQVSEWWYHHGSFNLFFRITLINNKHMYPLVTGLVISWHNYYQNTTKHSRKSALTWCRRHGVHHTIVFPGFLISSCDEFCCEVYRFFYIK